MCITFINDADDVLKQKGDIAYVHQITKLSMFTNYHNLQIVEFGTFKFGILNFGKILLISANFGKVLTKFVRIISYFYLYLATVPQN